MAINLIILAGDPCRLRCFNFEDLLGKNSIQNVIKCLCADYHSNAFIFITKSGNGDCKLKTTHKPTKELRSKEMEKKTEIIW